MKARFVLRQRLGAAVFATGALACAPCPCPAPATQQVDSFGAPTATEATEGSADPTRPPSDFNDHFVIENSKVIALTSQETGRDYRLLIGLPPSFENEPDRKYPTLYLLDGQWDFTLVNTLIGGLVYDGVVPEFLIVGITYGGESPDFGALRAEDYLPTRAQPRDAEKAFGGDAPKFLTFLESAVLPRMEKDFRAAPDHRILSGASFGGLFTLYALFERPELFHTYLALSPAVPWDHGWLFTKEEGFHDVRSRLDRNVWMSVGDAEEPDYLKQNREFFKQVENHEYEDLNLKVRVIDGERHAGNKPEAYNRALRFAFEEWRKQHEAD